MNNHQLFEISLKVILKNDKGEILLLKIGEGSEICGFYDLPGGRVDSSDTDDSFESSINREMREELGIDIEYQLNPIPMTGAIHFYHSKKTHEKVQAVWLIFEAEYLSGEVNLSDEHTEYMWKKINKDNINGLFVRGTLNSINNYLDIKESQK